MGISELFDGEDGFLSRIEPGSDVVKRAVKEHKNVRDILQTDERSKEWHEETFLSGSYSRDTSIDPIKDVDVIVITNFDPDDVTALEALNEVKDVLDDYYDTETEPQRRSIKVILEDTDLTLDVVPAVAPDGPDESLLIADKDIKQWVDTHPKAHIQMSSDLNAGTKDNDSDRGRLVPLVKVIKWWRHVQFPGKSPKGFALEYLVWQYHDPGARDWEDVVAAFFENAKDDLSSHIDSGKVPQLKDDEMQIDYALTKTFQEFEAFFDVLASSSDTARAALEAETLEEKATLWKQLFGDDTFPDAPNGGGNGSSNNDSSGSKGSRFGAPSVLRRSPSDVRESEPFG